MKTIRAPPPAIIIKPREGIMYSKILKSVKKDINISSIGTTVKSLKQGRSGNLIIHLARGDEKIQELNTALTQVLGDRATVREQVQSTKLEILDLDGVTTKEEVEEAIRIVAGLPRDDTSVKIRNLRSPFSGL